VIIRRNSPQLFNLGHNRKAALHDGRVQFIDVKLTLPENINSESLALLEDALDAQTLFPLISRDEMREQIGDNSTNSILDSNTHLETLLSDWVLVDSEYQTMFQEAYPKDLSFNSCHMVHAIGRFIKNKFNVRKTVYDRYLIGDESALTENQTKGFQLFMTKADCIKCHSGGN